MSNRNLSLASNGVSLLGLHFFTQRLRRDWLRRDLFAIFIIGWQAHFLLVD
ncbi:MAG: hypothetical protein HC847_17430 [Hydrococcus sp. RU_2_2]|nr:hypothetical protein [Hydrococcus sp. RU_2_2]